jgi:iron complex transport system substrate-binding protein
MRACNVAINAEYVEPTLLGRSEWLKFTAAFLNRDGLAQRRFTEMADSLSGVCRSRFGICRLRRNRACLAAFCTGTCGMCRAVESFIACLVADAGGMYRWADDTHRGQCIALELRGGFRAGG